MISDRATYFKSYSRHRDLGPFPIMIDTSIALHLLQSFTENSFFPMLEKSWIQWVS